MVIRQIERHKYDGILDILRKSAHKDPLRADFDVDIAVNGSFYQLTLYPESPRKIVALQAVKAIRDGEGKRFELLTEWPVLNALLEIWLYQLP